MTAEFLDALDPHPDSLFTVETYTDAPKGSPKSRPDPLSRQWPDLTRAGVLALVPELTRLNYAGAGVFISVNEFHGPRKKANLKRVRGIHADFDDIDTNKLRAAFAASKPSIVVESSPEKAHVYWLLHDSELMDIETAENINRHLVQAYGADPAATDASRLLRLPGFRHMKARANGNTPPVRLMKTTNRRYTVDELKEAFAPVLSTPPQLATPASANTIAANPSTVAPLVSVCERAEPALWQGQWDTRFHSQSEADLTLAIYIARQVIMADIPEAERFNTIAAIFNQSGLAVRDKWQSRPDYRERTINAAIARAAQSPATQQQTQSKAEEHGDVLNGRAFARLWRGQLIYVPSAGKWLQWVGE